MPFPDGNEEWFGSSTRNLLDKSSVAQSLDGHRLTGRLLIPFAKPIADAPRSQHRGPAATKTLRSFAIPRFCACATTIWLFHRSCRNAQRHARKREQSYFRPTLVGLCTGAGSSYPEARAMRPCRRGAQRGSEGRLPGYSGRPAFFRSVFDRLLDRRRHSRDRHQRPSHLVEELIGVFLLRQRFRKQSNHGAVPKL